ncbi:MAG: ribbon-helix-helix protein, CopG family [Deltaproteobacteria bacterium]|nr:ribbon-helix-helix protein, CopG family [Deltaproteobacteria bacterium]
MPAVSFYLPKDLEEKLRAEAQLKGKPVSRILREAVKVYLEAERKRKAREGVVRLLLETRPLGTWETWEEIHRERSADRH